MVSEGCFQHTRSRKSITLIVSCKAENSVYLINWDLLPQTVDLKKKNKKKKTFLKL